MNNLEQATKTASIANGESLSGSVSMGQARTLVAVQTPATWTAAAISFDVSMDDSTFVALYDDQGTEVTIPSASIATGAARGFSLDPRNFVGWKYVKVRSGLNGAAMNQAGARSVILIFREAN